MRILIVNTSEQSGGAAVAAHRLKDALNNSGDKARMLVRDKQTDDVSVVGLRQSWRQQWRFLWERWCIFLHLHFSRKNLFKLDIANTGTDITRLREFKEADVIHLHWVNQGMLSLTNIRKILDSGKPVVWTMHDVWPATAICHLTLGCQNFKSQCCRCKYLPGKGSENDLAAKVWKRKQAMLRGRNIWFVACSKWLAGEAKKSALLKNQQITTIPNPIDTRVFYPKDKVAARQRLGLPIEGRLLLFVSQRVTHANKGMNYLVEACKELTEKQPEMAKTTGIVILGGHAEDFDGKFQMPTYPLGYISDTQRIVDVYNAADLFVLPSLSENLPNTIMEAMACGVPCIGFNVGGIPEMIEHRICGYVAKYKDIDDLARGINWVLNEADHDSLAKQALRKVHTKYSEQAVALQYTEVYHEAMAYNQIF
ncbi:MAG: glycosyltransferase family 4 protein [Prevotella sp.]|nr:glycosyltransferase family 4 protein [Prevotella sp.]